MIGINESHLAASAYLGYERCGTLWRAAVRKAVELDLRVPVTVRPFPHTAGGNLDVGSLRRWIDAVERPTAADQKGVVSAKQANLDLLARYVVTVAPLLPQEIDESSQAEALFDVAEQVEPAVEVKPKPTVPVESKPVEKPPVVEQPPKPQTPAPETSAPESPSIDTLRPFVRDNAVDAIADQTDWRTLADLPDDPSEMTKVRGIGEETAAEIVKAKRQILAGQTE